MVSSLDNGFSLYIHVPFCSKKCGYCHFYVLKHQKSHVQLYLKALEQEIARVAPFLKKYSLKTIYFGGGTPFLLSEPEIEKIFVFLKEAFPLRATSLEVTFEANPEHISTEKVSFLKDLGVNRMSLGVQSLNDSLLKILGRTHTALEAKKAVEKISKSGINNISIDLMMEIPRQTLIDWKSSLKEVVSWPITHLSLYNLTFEPATAFYRRRKHLAPFICDESTSIEMYRFAHEFLLSFEFEHYEISAFAKEGKISQHNVGYWTQRSFIGLGPSAFSYWKGERFSNTRNLKEYITSLHKNQSPVVFRESLTEKASLREEFVIQLRMLDGASENILRSLDDETCDELFQLISEGYLEKERGKIKLTQKGILCYDAIAVQLI